MEIGSKIVHDKITLVISDYVSKVDFFDCANVTDYVQEKIEKKSSVVIDDIGINFYEFTVEEVIKSFLDRYNLKGKKAIDKVLKLSTLSVDYLQKDPLLLKDSEKFKLLLTLVLSLNPKVIIVENMSCFLDNKSRCEIMFTLRRLKREFNKTIVIVDNDVDYFYTICDNVLVVQDDKVLVEGKKSVLYDNYTLLKRKKIPIPACLEFIRYVKEDKNVDVLIRDNVKDIMKDVYRCL